MCLLRGEKGAALVTALMLTMLSLVIAMALLSTVIGGARTSASQKRYRTALAATYGGVELATQEIIPDLLQSSPPSASSLADTFAKVQLQIPQYSCLQQKLSKPTAVWRGTCSDSADPTVAPDLLLELHGQSQEASFSVVAKVVDSVPGNTDKSGNNQLDLGLGTSARDEVVHPQHVPGIYNLSVQGGREGGAQNEKARLSVLYAY
jgi:hypothetical protein